MSKSDEYVIELNEDLFHAWNILQYRQPFIRCEVASSMFQNTHVITHKQFAEFKKNISNIIADAEKDCEKYLREIKALRVKSLKRILEEPVPF